MASDTYWQLEKEYYNIAPDHHDFVVRLIEHHTVTRYEGDPQEEIVEPKPNKIHEYKVNRDTLIDGSALFAQLLSDDNTKGSQPDTIDIREDAVQAMNVWFKILHYNIDDSTYTICIDDVWNMLATAEKYGFDTKTDAAKTWFNEWYAYRGPVPQGDGHAQRAMFDYREHQQLLLPTYTFDHAYGFGQATRFLVYKATNLVSERRPPGFEDSETLKLDPRIIFQLNAAKSRLRTILHRALYNPISALLLRARCRDRPHVLCAYESALLQTGAWPIETASLNHSIDRLCKLLESLRIYPQHATCGSRPCTFDIKEVVEAARKECRAYFHGLCLDCVKLSATSEDEEVYWQRSQLGTSWDAGCRWSHSQPRWYFSYLGPKGRMAEWVEGNRVQHAAAGRGGGGSGVVPGTYGWVGGQVPHGRNGGGQSDVSGGQMPGVDGGQMQGTNSGGGVQSPYAGYGVGVTGAMRQLRLEAGEQ